MSANIANYSQNADSSLVSLKSFRQIVSFFCKICRIMFFRQIVSRQIVGNKLKWFGTFFGKNIFGKPHVTKNNAKLSKFVSRFLSYYSSFLFRAYLCCTKCRYSTCCSKAISVHVALFHGSTVNPVYNLGAPVVLDSDIFCCCGFKTNSGNKMGESL